MVKLLGVIMKRALLIFLLGWFCSNTYTNDIFLVSDGSRLFIVNKSGDRIEGPIRIITGSSSNLRFYYANTAVIQKHDDRKYYLINSSGEWLYSSEKELYPASDYRVWRKEGDSTWVLVDFSGKIYFTADLAPRYFVIPFQNDISIVTESDQSKIIDENGNVLEIIPYLFNPGGVGFLPWNNEGYFLAIDYSKGWSPGVFWYTIINSTFEAQFPVKQLSFPGFVSEGVFFSYIAPLSGAYITIDGDYILTDKNINYGSWFAEDLAPVSMQGRLFKDFIDKDGNIILNGQELGIYDANPFNEGLASVSIRESDSQLMRNVEWDNANEDPGLWGAIDPDGNWVIEPQFPYSFFFHRGLAYIQVDVKYTSEPLKSRGSEFGYATRTLLINKFGEIVWDSLPYNIEILEMVDAELVDDGYPVLTQN
jgi:hypothetical protein